MYKQIQKRTHEIIEKASRNDTTSLIFDIFIISLISVNVLIVILETVSSVYVQWAQILHLIDYISVIIFTAEYILRLWSAPAKALYRKPISGRIKFAFTPLLIIDLLSIVPFYLPLLFPFDLRVIKALRLFRLFRILKIARYSKSLNHIILVIKAKKEELLITLFAVFILMTIASSFMYYFENQAQPQDFSSIPAAMWWAVSTLTTVGYGDVYPITNMGKVLSGIISLLGIGIFALPAGILASGYAEEIQNKREKIQCPKCHKKFTVRQGKKVVIPTTSRHI